MNGNDMPDQLPEDWLPEAASGDDADEAVWRAREREIVNAAESRLRELSEEAGSTPYEVTDTGWLQMARWWRPAAALAAAAVLVLFLTRPVRPEAPAGAGSPALGAIVSEGEPTSLWQATGREAHPVLALIALDREEP